MKLIRIKVKDYRSFFGEHEFDVSGGANYFVGPNNSGKSNLVRAVELALNPDIEYDVFRDRPARDQLGKPPTTRITLVFQLGGSSPEKTVLKRARDYEIALRKSQKRSVTDRTQTYADDNEVHFVTAFGARGRRSTSFQARSLGAVSLPASSREHIKLIDQFRRTVRFAVIHSGEDLASLLSGKFREILNLVLAEHLAEPFAKAEQAREEYLKTLQSELLEPLRHLIETRVQGLFDEIHSVELTPDLPSVSHTLSNVDIRLGDGALTQLADKGTGVRGAVLVAMLQYLASQSARSLVLAVEEPEAFLHPGAQEALRDHLERLTHRSDVSLLLTTHSPYVISRAPRDRISELAKDVNGRTYQARSAAGDEPRAEVLGSLFRDPGFAQVLESSLTVPADARFVLITEGYTDDQFIRLVCECVGRGDLMEGVHVIPAGGAQKVVHQAVLTKAATHLPVLAVLDHDEHGVAAAKALGKLQWSKSSDIVMLNSWPLSCNHHSIEIEDLLPMAPVKQLIEQVGENHAIDSKEKCGNSWHYRLSAHWKRLALAELAGSMNQQDEGGMVWLAEELNTRAKKLA